MQRTLAIAVIIIIMTAVGLTVSVSAQGPVPPLAPAGGGITASGDSINFQGRLYDSSGAQLGGITVNMRFTICGDDSCTSMAWGPTEIANVETDLGGYFSVLLGGSGTGDAFTADHFAGNRWLRVEVCNAYPQDPCTAGWDVMNDPELQPLTSVAIAVGNIRKNLVDTSTASSANYVLAITNSGIGDGLWGLSSGTNGTGLYGYNSSSGFGVFGESASGGLGTVGYSPDNVGAWGESASGEGVHGYASDTTGDVYGVVGHAQSTTYYLPPLGSSGGVVGSVATADDYGVFGINPNVTGQAYGVVGLASTTSINLPGSGSVGVLGSVERSTDYGVWGYNDNASGGVGTYGYGFTGAIGYSSYSRGVFGQTDHSSWDRGQAVVGYASNTTASVHGVYGVAGTASWQVPDNPTGVAGYVNNASGIGVWGLNDSTSGGDGVYGEGFYGVVGATTDPINGWSGYFMQDVYIANYAELGGDLWVGNNAYARNFYYHVIVDGEQLVLYPMNSPDNWSEDFGQGTLIDGQAVVNIEPRYVKTVNLTQDYHIFLTPLGDCQGLYVAAKTSTSFEVRELGGGQANIAFDYRIVAKRQGYEALRMQAVPEPGPTEKRPVDPAGHPPAVDVTTATAQPADAGANSSTTSPAVVQPVPAPVHRDPVKP